MTGRLCSNFVSTNVVDVSDKTASESRYKRGVSKNLAKNFLRDIKRRLHQKYFSTLNETSLNFSILTALTNGAVHEFPPRRESLGKESLFFPCDRLFC